MTIEKIAAPSLNLAPSQFEQSEDELFRNTLRLFFNRLIALLNNIVNDVEDNTYPPMLSETTTSRVVSSADRGGVITCTNAGAVSVSVPQNSDEALDIGFNFWVMQGGAGTVTVSAGAGATLNVPTSAATSAQWASIFVMKTGADTWTVMDN